MYPPGMNKLVFTHLRYPNISQIVLIIQDASSAGMWPLLIPKLPLGPERAYKRSGAQPWAVPGYSPLRAARKQTRHDG